MAKATDDQYLKFDVILQKLETIVCKLLLQETGWRQNVDLLNSCWKLTLRH